MGSFSFRKRSVVISSFWLLSGTSGFRIMLRKGYSSYILTASSGVIYVDHRITLIWIYAPKLEISPESILPSSLTSALLRELFFREKVFVIKPYSVRCRANFGKCGRIMLQPLAEIE